MRPYSWFTWRLFWQPLNCEGKRKSRKNHSVLGRIDRTNTGPGNHCLAPDQPAKMESFQHLSSLLPYVYFYVVMSWVKRGSCQGRMKPIISRTVKNGLHDSDISIRFGYGCPTGEIISFVYLSKQAKPTCKHVREKKNGFHIESRGREGIIYYAEDGRRCEIYFEMSESINPWYPGLFWQPGRMDLPVKERISATDKRGSGIY